jgi:hypothetical protein
VIAALYSADGKYQRSVRFDFPPPEVPYAIRLTDDRRYYHLVGRVGENALYREEP